MATYSTDSIASSNKLVMVVVYESLTIALERSDLCDEAKENPSRQPTVCPFSSKYFNPTRYEFVLPF